MVSIISCSSSVRIPGTAKCIRLEAEALAACEQADGVGQDREVRRQQARGGEGAQSLDVLEVEVAPPRRLVAVLLDLRRPGQPGDDAVAVVESGLALDDDHRHGPWARPDEAQVA